MDPVARLLSNHHDPDPKPDSLPRYHRPAFLFERPLLLARCLQGTTGAITGSLTQSQWRLLPAAGTPRSLRSCHPVVSCNDVAAALLVTSLRHGACAHGRFRVSTVRHRIRQALTKALT